MLLPTLIKSDCVCDLETLLLEIKQDIADNGMLDCLRVINPPHFVEETEKQKNLRLAAQWDTSCSFEADSDWMTKASKYLGINQLFDSIGEPVQKDFKNQADMCEIIRAAVVKGSFKIKNLNMQNLPANRIVNKIGCAGTADGRGTRICAASGSSYFQRDSWTFLIGSNSIKFGKRPKFVKGRPKKKAKKGKKKSTAQILKSLLQLWKKALENGAGKIAGMIDKELDPSSGKSSEKEKDHQKENSRLVHVHVKRTITTSIGNTGSFSPVQGGTISFKLDEPKLLFCFLMTAFTLQQKGKLFLKMVLNGREISETRQGLGLIKQGALTSAFSQVVETDGSNPIVLGILGDTNTKADINSGLYDHNFSFGCLSMPKGSVFKRTNRNPLSFLVSEAWKKLASFSITIKALSDRYYLIFYNIALKIADTGVLHTRLNVDQKGYQETATSTGQVEEIGNHSAFVVKLNAGSHVAKMEYKYDGKETLTFNTFTDAHYAQGLTALELPENTKVHNYKVEKNN